MVFLQVDSSDVCQQEPETTERLVRSLCLAGCPVVAWSPCDQAVLFVYGATAPLQFVARWVKGKIVLVLDYLTQLSQYLIELVHVSDTVVSAEKKKNNNTGQRRGCSRLQCSSACELTFVTSAVFWFSWCKEPFNFTEIRCFFFLIIIFFF